MKDEKTAIRAQDSEKYVLMERTMGAAMIVEAKYPGYTLISRIKLHASDVFVQQ